MAHSSATQLPARRAAHTARAAQAAEPKPGSSTAGYTISRRARHWEVIDPAGLLVCLTVYKCGAKEVVRRLSS